MYLFCLVCLFEYHLFEQVDYFMIHYVYEVLNILISFAFAFGN